MPCLQHFLEGVLSGGATRTLRGDAALSPPVWESEACPWPQDASCSSSASTSRNFRNHQVNTSFEKEEGMDEEEEIDESKLESGLPDDDERTECNLDSLKLGNQTGKWSKEKEDIKWAYDNSLKGQEVQVWWPGRTDHGECNNLHDEDRGCWFRAKLLNDPYCTDAGRCIHFAAHDGEPTNTFSCPTWIRDPDGIGCRLPRFNWQACPMKFEMKRVDTGIPQEFKQALSTPCSAAKAPEAPPVPENQFPVRDEKGEVKEAPGAPPDEAAGEAQKVPAKDDGAGKDPGKEPENAAPPDGHCNGPTNDKDEARMIMDLKKNAWYRCNEMMRCEPWDIRKIIDEENPQCGKKKCGPDEQCFVHRVSALQSTYQCVKTENAMVIADGDDAAKLSVPFPLVICSFQQLKASAPRRKTLRRFL